jgi:hypothetical protein
VGNQGSQRCKQVVGLGGLLRCYLHAALHAHQSGLQQVVYLLTIQLRQSRHKQKAWGPASSRHIYPAASMMVQKLTHHEAHVACRQLLAGKVTWPADCSAATAVQEQL